MSLASKLPVHSAKGEFVRLLFDTLEGAQIRYCVLHGWDGLPDYMSSDLDLVIHPDDFGKMSLIFKKLAGAGYKWIQCRNYAAHSYRFDFAWFEGNTLHVVGVDTIYEYRYAGLILASGQKLLEGRRQHNGFWIASRENVFSYLLMKKSVKAAITPDISLKQSQELRELAQELGERVSVRLASEVFGPVLGSEVVRACLNENVQPLLPKMSSQIRNMSLGSSVSNLFRYHVPEKLRQIHRWFKPTGLFVVVLGPDGVGKTTVLDRLVKAFEPAFKTANIFHYRAKFKDSKSSAPVTDPHAKPPRGTLASIARLLLLCLQFWASYLWIVRPKLARSGLVVFDRYFHDILVDRKRYRYGGPEWVLRLVLPLAPAPDLLFLVFDADESVILSRKQEVTLEELHQLRAGYQRLTHTYGNSFLVRTDQIFDDTVAIGMRLIYDHLLRRASRRYPQWHDSAAFAKGSPDVSTIGSAS